MARRAKQAAAKPERPTRVLLVRHGHTESTGTVLPGRTPGLNLSDTGRAQAQRTAELIAEGATVDAIYTSSLERARQTAAPIAQATGRRAKVDRGLLEVDFGEWTGQQLVALMKKPEWATVQRTPSSFRFPGGESFAEMQLRIVSTIDRLRAAHPGGTIVCVSHADPIKAAIAHAIGTHLDLFQRIVVSPASVSVLAFLDGGPVVLSVNSTGRPLQELTPS
jgi:probable phosphomutase (TIGR03848 family)